MSSGKIDVLNQLLIDTHIEQCVLLLSKYDTNILNKIGYICLTKMVEIISTSKDNNFSYLLGMYRFDEVMKSFDKKNRTKTKIGGANTPPKDIVLPASTDEMTASVAALQSMATNTASQSAGQGMIKNATTQVELAREALYKAHQVMEDKKKELTAQVTAEREAALKAADNDYDKLSAELTRVRVYEGTAGLVVGTSAGLTVFNLTSLVDNAFLLITSFLANLVYYIQNILINLFTNGPCDTFGAPIYQPGLGGQCTPNLFYGQTCTGGTQGRCVSAEGFSFGVSEVTTLMAILCGITVGIVALIGTSFLMGQTHANEFSKGYIKKPFDLFMKMSIVGWGAQTLLSSEGRQKLIDTVHEGKVVYRERRKIIPLGDMIKEKFRLFFEHENAFYEKNIRFEEDRLRTAVSDLEATNRDARNLIMMHQKTINAIAVHQAGLEPFMQEHLVLGNSASSISHKQLGPSKSVNTNTERNVLRLEDKSSAGGARLKKRITNRKGYLKNRKTKKRVMYRKRK